MNDRRMHDTSFHRQGDIHSPQDLGEHLASITSRLKLNFRSTRCSGQSFPPFNKQLCKGNNLPNELQELILLHLPTLRLLELKSVCRSWRDLLQSSKFQETWRHIRGKFSDDWINVWVMKGKEDKDLIAYVPAVDKYCLFVSLLCSPVIMNQPLFTIDLKNVNVLCVQWPFFVFGKEDWRSVPSFLMYDLHGRSIQVPKLQLEEVGSPDDINSILPSSLPELIIIPGFYGFAVEVHSVSENRPHPLNQLLVFNLSRRSWRHYPQPSATQANLNDMDAVLHGFFFRYDQEENILYAWSELHWSKAVVTFSGSSPHDMPNRELSSIQNAEVNAEVNAFKVVRNRRDIFLLTSMVQQQERGGVTQCFIVWKLIKGAMEPETWNWSEVSRTPAELCLKGFNRESFMHPTAICDGSHICILSSTTEFSPALVYDVMQGRWYHLHGVFRDMQALFATSLRLTVDGLAKQSDPFSRQYELVRQNSRRYPWRGLL